MKFFAEKKNTASKKGAETFASSSCPAHKNTNSFFLGTAIAVSFLLLGLILILCLPVLSLLLGGLIILLAVTKLFVEQNTKLSLLR